MCSFAMTSNFKTKTKLQNQPRSQTKPNRSQKPCFRLGSTRPGVARSGWARRGSVSIGPARLGTARLSWARPGSARLGQAQSDLVRIGSARPGI